MCRLLARVGPTTDLEAVLYGGPWSLEHQSWAPRQQRHGTINADGWGVGWYDRNVRPEPARYRTARPMWSDERFRSVAGLARSDCVLAAVRSATPPSPVVEVNAPPFTAGPWLFAHNGAVAGWHDGVGEVLRRAVSPERASGILGSTDSEVLFALLLDRLDRAMPPPEALLDVAATVTAVADARCTMVLTDGAGVHALAWGDGLVRRDADGATTIASEPTDDAGGWEPVADRTTTSAGADP